MSHIGGDRFARSVVSFPPRLYFGRGEPSDAAAVAKSYEAGRIELAHYRGRSALPFPVQAAECFLRKALGIVEIDALAVVGHEALPEGRVEVAFAGTDGREHRVRIAISRSQPARPLTCKSTKESQPPAYALEAIATSPA